MPFSLTHEPIPSYTPPPKEEPYHSFSIRPISFCPNFTNGALKFSTAPGRLYVATVLELIASTRVMNCREISSDMEVKAEISIFYVSYVIIGR